MKIKYKWIGSNPSNLNIFRFKKDIKYLRPLHGLIWIDFRFQSGWVEYFDKNLICQDGSTIPFTTMFTKNKKHLAGNPDPYQKGLHPDISHSDYYDIIDFRNVLDERAFLFSQQEK